MEEVATVLLQTSARHLSELYMPP